LCSARELESRNQPQYRHTALLYSPEMSSAFLDFQLAEAKSTSLDARVRQVVILAVGAVWKAPYEIYAHAAVARKLGFSEEDISKLSAGQSPASLSGAERIAQQYASQGRSQ
jgi:4-carboxymuconolactone decarboxylase